MPLHIQMKHVLLLTLCILNKQNNLQTKIATDIYLQYYRAHFAQQGKTCHSSKHGLLLYS